VGFHEPRRVEWPDADRPGLSTFVFVVGASIVFAFEARLARGATRAWLAWHTLRRAGTLFLLGIVVNGFRFFHLDHLRIYGVLQRIAVCYLVVGLFYLWDKRVWTKVAVLVAVLRVTGHCCAGFRCREQECRYTTFLPRSDLNLAAWLDRHIMPGHYTKTGRRIICATPKGCSATFRGRTALLGCSPGCGCVVNELSRQDHWADRGQRCPARLGLSLVAVVPLNKKMWTSSYVLVAAGGSGFAGASLLGGGAAGWAGRTRGRGNKWICVVVFGSNAIVAYMFSELVPSALYNMPFTANGKRTDALAWLFNTSSRTFRSGWAAFAFSVRSRRSAFFRSGALSKENICEGVTGCRNVPARLQTHGWPLYIEGGKTWRRPPGTLRRTV